MKKKLVLLLLSLCLSGCTSKVIEKTETKDNDVIQEEQTEDVEQEVEEEPIVEIACNDDLEKSIHDSIDKHPGNAEMSVYIEVLGQDDSLSIDSHKMQAASLIKLYIAGAIYEHYDEVKDMDDIDALVLPMLNVSDNSAANQLVIYLGNGDEVAGRRIVNEYCLEHGYTQTHMGRMLLADNSVDDNYTSVKDCGKFLSDVYHKSIQGSSKILACLEQQQVLTKIPLGIPNGIKVANKTGELCDVENDVAIVELDGHPYILCIMSEQLALPTEARETIIEISSIVYDGMNQ